MMKRTIEKTAAFLLVGCLLLSLLEALFVEKSSYGKNRGWKAAKDVDILILRVCPTSTTSITRMPNM